ncbi:MAG: FMN-binding negative transcriptional regulator [Beijerinckiaceae bacterium]
MYQPPHFKIEDTDTMLALIAAHPLGLLISAGARGVLANPVPFVAVRTGEAIDLRCHLAKPNPQWQAIEEGADMLVVFQGAGAYVTPGWYATKKETGKVVPTWNYMIVQARGTATTHHDADWLRAQIDLMTNQQEQGRAESWAVSDAPDNFTQAQMRGIVGVNIRVTDMQGKFKLSQNRNEADRHGVIAGLANEAGSAKVVGDIMRERENLRTP